MFKVMDRGSYEKLSIRDSARSLKKYGSTSKHVNKNENYVKHFVCNTDTLQGIALKYDVTIEQIRRANRLWASDSLFLKPFLLIPVADQTAYSHSDNSGASNTPTPIVSPSSISNCSFEDDNVEDFLGKIDASIASTKKEVKKAQGNSEYAPLGEFSSEKRKAVSRMKKTVNNNGSKDLLPSPPAAVQTVVVQHGTRTQSSLHHAQHEKQQDELFEL